MEAHGAHAKHDHDHGHGHHHDHAAEFRRTPTRKLAIALALTCSFMIVEVIMGWLSGSLALLADAGHMLSDSAALVLALVAQHIAKRPRSKSRTFGSRRAEVLAAFVNGIALAVTAVLIIREAIERLWTPHDITASWMLITAVLGLVVNIVAAIVLGGGGRENPNTRAAFIHVLSDALGSAGAIVAALLVLFLGWFRADSVISLVIASLILWGAWRLVRETTRVLMEGTPPHVDVTALEATIHGVRGVQEVHDVHVWTISDGFHAVTAHLVLDGSCHGTEVVEQVSRRIKLDHDIDHVTLQPEAPPPGLVQLRIPRSSRCEEVE